MITSIISKPFEAFAYIVEKEIKIEDKLKDFAKKSFSSIKDIKHAPSKIFNFVKENKSKTALAISSLAISIIVFLSISATAGILCLGAISFLETFAYARAYVKTDNYQFKKIAKKYIHSIEILGKIYKNGKKLNNDLVTGLYENKFYNLQEELITFIKNNAKSYNRRKNAQNYLANLNPNLWLYKKSFPVFTIWKSIHNKVFKNHSAVHIKTYFKELFNYIDNQEKTDFKNKLKDLVKGYSPQNLTLKQDILNKSKTIKSFLEESTKNDIATELYEELTSSITAQNQTAPTPSKQSKNSVYNLFGLLTSKK